MIEITSILDVEKYIDDVEVVIFDLDDTLYSEKEYVRSGYRKIAEWLRKPIFEDKLWEVFLNGGKAIDEVFASEGIINLKDEALRIYRFHEPDIHLYSGVREMLSRIINSGKKLAIITDGRPEGQRNKINALNLSDVFDEIIVTDELGGIEYRKPNPESFIKMQKLLNVSFEQMVYVGDNLSKDFIAPDNLGMNSILFKNRDGLYYL